MADDFRLDDPWVQTKRPNECLTRVALEPKKVQKLLASGGRVLRSGYATDPGAEQGRGRASLAWADRTVVPRRYASRRCPRLLGHICKIPRLPFEDRLDARPEEKRVILLPLTEATVSYSRAWGRG